MKRAIIVIAFALALPAHAQVYKCAEGGKTIYSQTPCAANAKPIELKVHHPSEEDLQRARRQAAINAEAQAIRNEYQQRADERREMARARAASEPDECDRMLQEHAEAKRLAGEYQHPANIRREQERAKKIASNSFFRCGPGRRVSE